MFTVSSGDGLGQKPPPYDAANGNTAQARLGQSVGDGTRRLDAADVAHALVERVELGAVLCALQLQLLEPFLEVHELHL